MRILAIEFGGSSLKAVEMESRFRRMEVLELHDIPLPIKNVDPTANYRQAVADLMARLPSIPEKIITSLPASQTALRFLKIPLKQRKKVEQSFRFELEDTVPFKLDESIVEHFVQPEKLGSLVFAAIAPKKHILSHLEWLKSIGVDPDWLTFEGMGNINLCLASLYGKDADKDAEAPTGPIALLDIGHVKTNLSILNEGRLEFFRTISWGGLAISQAIASALMISLEDAEKRKIRELRLEEESSISNTEHEELTTAATQALSSMMTDVAHSFVSYRSQYGKDISQILLVGGTAKTQGIDDFFAKNLNIKTSFFKPFHGISFSREVNRTLELRFGEALGRALVFSRKSELLFNFRKEELGKGTSLHEVTKFFSDPVILKLGRYAAVLALILFSGLFALGYVAQEESKRAQDELKKVFAETFREVAPKARAAYTSDPKTLTKFIDQKNNELNQKLKMIAKNKATMMSLVRAISEAFPPDVPVDVNLLSLDDRSLRIEGVVYGGKATEMPRVTDNLKKIASFTNVELSVDGQRFTFKGEVTGR